VLHLLDIAEREGGKDSKKEQKMRGRRQRIRYRRKGCN
jgi:hypothetical protein